MDYKLQVWFYLPEEIAKRLAAAGVTGEAAKQMMAAVKGGGRKYPSLVPCSLASHHTDAVMTDGVTILQYHDVSTHYF